MRSFEIISEYGSKTQWIEIEVSAGHFTQMTKEAYDKQAEQSTPSLTSDGYLTPPAIMESTRPDEADLTERNN